jgi:hypothetical protein
MRLLAAVFVLLMLAACVPNRPVEARESFWLLIENRSGAPIVVVPEAPVDRSGAWLVQPGETGPYAYARAGTRVDIRSEECELIGDFVLPTKWGAGGPVYFVHPGGAIEQVANPWLGIGDLPPQAGPGKRLCP